MCVCFHRPEPLTAADKTTAVVPPSAFANFQTGNPSLLVTAGKIFPSKREIWLTSDGYRLNIYIFRLCSIQNVLERKKIQHVLNWVKAVTKSDCQSKRIRAAVKVNSDRLAAYWCRIWLDHCNPGYDSFDGCVPSCLHHFKQGQSHLVETPFDFDCSGTLLCCILIVQFIYCISGVCVCVRVLWEIQGQHILVCHKTSVSTSPPSRAL